MTRSPVIALAAAMRRLESVPILGWPLIRARLINHPPSQERHRWAMKP